jgi:hypothetical protein
MEIFPKFIIGNTKDLMVKGGDFYAYYDETLGRWSRDPSELITAIDRELDKYYEEHKELLQGTSCYICYMRDSDSGSIDKWHHFVKRQMHDHFKLLDDSIVFNNSPIDRELYSSHRLKYDLIEQPTPAWDKLTETLYSYEERLKFEWAIGSIIEGDSRWIQKFIVFFGDAGTGKSTILKIIKMLFEGYTSTIDAKAIGSSTSQFALETISNNPLVAINDDTDLSKIDDNSRLNSLISHEEVVVNEKFKSQYATEFHAMIFLGTNKEVNITDSKSGLTRRLIDVMPSGNKLPFREYNKLMKTIPFELPGIAWKCHQIYLANKEIYNSYVPIRMMRSTNYVYSWLEENLSMVEENDGISLASAWASYKQYCEDGDIVYRLNKIKFKNELSGYFESFEPEYLLDNGHKVYNYYVGLKSEKFRIKNTVEKPPSNKTISSWLKLDKTESLLDLELADCPAQYATEEGTPVRSWDNNKTVLSDIDTRRLHYVRPPRQLIVIDFDIKNEGGGKDYILNAEAAEHWPETYAELSKSGAGIHLHYWYDGDVNALSSIVAPNIEVKVFKGKSPLRRQVSYCNDLPIAHISTGLPLKEVKTMVNVQSLKNERALITFILRNLKKQYHADTHSSVSFIKKGLDDAYSSGMPYYIPEELREAVMKFAESSTNQSDDCKRMVRQMHWSSDEYVEEEKGDDLPIAIFDVEVYPNLFVVVAKPIGKPHMVWINPEPTVIEYILSSFRLVGHNCRRYDNHIMHARLMGYSNLGLFKLSSEIVSTKRNENKNCFFRTAYGYSYADTYDYPTLKQSLKKWEIDLHLPHMEMDIPWDKPVPEELWSKIVEYCKNDVSATEQVWLETQGDFTAREILAEWAEMTPNTPTNTLTAKIIFSGDKAEFHWRDLSKPVAAFSNSQIEKFFKEECGKFVEPFDEHSVVPYFPGYKFVDGKSSYRGIDEVGEGGFVMATWGIHYNVALLDVESMHPNSYIDELYSGLESTRRFMQILQLRLYIKHKNFEAAEQMFNGRFKKYLSDKKMAKALTKALKIAINSVYGLTAAHFENPFYSKYNVDNIVAKRGALFMIDLMYAVKEKGFVVAHIKTDSIKIPNATPEIIDFVMKFGEKYGYRFAHEATYEKMCLVNNAVYAAKYMTAEKCEELYNYIPEDNLDYSGKWTATGTQFQVPFVFKSLFTHEQIIFDDVCETKSVTTAIYLDMAPDSEEHDYKFIGRVGEFTPVKAGGGIMYRKTGDKFNSISGTKGYKWVESSVAKNLPPEIIDYSYYYNLVDAARDAIAQYGDVESFVA